MNNSDAATTPLEDINFVTEPSAARLNERQQLDYRTEREQCLEWLYAVGKTPKRGEGYAFTTVKTRGSRMDQFYRWVWDTEDGYTASLTTDHADAYLQHLARQETSNAHKNSSRKAVMMLYKWRHHQRGGDAWEPDITFTQPHTSTAPRDYLTRAERRQIRDASLEYRSVPDPTSVSGADRDRWEAYLAQRFEKPKAEVTAADWERANSWKIPSLVATRLDAGLRPIEVERATTDWVDLENGVLRIPREEASKNAENWIVSLQDRTVTTLDRWLAQRRTKPKYDDTDTIWLTCESNPLSNLIAPVYPPEAL